MIPIIPNIRREPFDDPAWLFDLKLDGFRGIADTICGRRLILRDHLGRVSGVKENGPGEPRPKSGRKRPKEGQPELITAAVVR